MDSSQVIDDGMEDKDFDKSITPHPSSAQLAVLALDLVVHLRMERRLLVCRTPGLGLQCDLKYRVRFLPY